MSSFASSHFRAPSARSRLTLSQLHVICSPPERAIPLVLLLNLPLQPANSTGPLRKPNYDYLRIELRPTPRYVPAAPNKVLDTCAVLFPPLATCLRFLNCFTSSSAHPPHLNLLLRRIHRDFSRLVLPASLYSPPLRNRPHYRQLFGSSTT